MNEQEFEGELKRILDRYLDGVTQSAEGLLCMLGPKGFNRLDAAKVLVEVTESLERARRKLASLGLQPAITH